MDAAENPAYQCPEWTDEYLLAQYALGPSGYADPHSYQLIRSEVRRRNLPEVVPSAPVDLPTGPYLARLWRGEVPLGITFWGWFVVGAHLLALLVRSVERAALAAAKTTSGDFASFIGLGAALLVLAFVGYLVLALVAVWRSAAQYRGAPILAALARIFVALNVLGLIVLFVAWL